MATIFTPNILLSSDFESIQNLFIKPENGILDFESLQSNKTFWMVSPLNNKYLKSFDFQFGLPDAKKTRLILTLSDVDNELQDTMFNNSFLAQFLQEEVDKAISKKKFLSTNIDNISNSIQKNQELFFAFGIGNNISDWGGPFKATMVNATIEASKGIKDITLEYIAGSNSPLFNTPQMEDHTSNENPSDHGGADVIYTGKHSFDFGRLYEDYHGETKITHRSRPMIKSNQIIMGDRSLLAPSKTQRITQGQKLNIDLDLHEIIPSFIDPNGPRNQSGHLVDTTLHNQDTSLEENRDKKNPTLMLYEVIVACLCDYVSVLTNYNPQILLLPNEFYKAIQTDGIENNIENKEGWLEWSARVTLPRYQGFVWWQGDQKFNKFKEVSKGWGVELSNIQDVVRETKAIREITFSGAKTGYSSFCDVSCEETITTETAKKVTAIISSSSKVEGEETDEDKTKKPNVPDAMAPFKKINAKISERIQGFVSNITIQNETDQKLLNLFIDLKLIPEGTTECNIIGESQMIKDFIYIETTGRTKEQMLSFATGGSKIRSDSLPTTKSKFKLFPENLPRLIGQRLAKKNLVAAESVLGTEDYVEKYITAMFNHKSDSSFNENQTSNVDELNFRPDVFNTITNSINSLKETNVPLFKYNMDRSNVLTVDIDMGKNFFSNLNFAVLEDRTKKFGDAVLSKEKKIVTNLDGLDVGEITKRITDLSTQDTNDTSTRGDMTLQGIDIELIIDTSEANKDLAKFKPYIVKTDQSSITYTHLAYLNVLIDLKSAGSLKNVDPEELLGVAQFLDAREKLSKSQGSPGVILAPREGSGGKYAILGKVIKYMEKSALVVKIKTLPFLHISGYKVLGMPAILISKKQNLITPSNNLSYQEDMEDNKSIIEFYSGTYTLLGWRHVINLTEAYSEFSLQKDPRSLDDASTKNNITASYGKTEEKDVRINQQDLRSRTLRERLGMRPYLESASFSGGRNSLIAPISAGGFYK